MDLNENIQRIHQMMGIVSEDNKSDFTKKMIDTLGVIDTIKYYGGYNNFKQHLNTDLLTREEKIEFIKDIIDNKYYGRLVYGDRGWGNDDDWSILESTESYDKVVSAYYSDELHLTTFYRDENGEFSGSDDEEEDNEVIKYEDLSDDMLDNAFGFLLSRD
jgi:hypothetical protein